MQDIRNELDRVSTTSVLGDTVICVVWLASSAVEGNVFENRAESNSVVDFWFLLFGETNALGVATALNVEDTGVGPDVLVVTNQRTVSIC